MWRSNCLFYNVLSVEITCRRIINWKLRCRLGATSIINSLLWAASSNKFFNTHNLHFFCASAFCIHFPSNPWTNSISICLSPQSSKMLLKWCGWRIFKNKFLSKMGKILLRIANHTPNQAAFPRTCRAHNRNEAVKRSVYALNHCINGNIWPKQVGKSANMPTTNLLSASLTIRKVLHKDNVQKNKMLNQNYKQRRPQVLTCHGSKNLGQTVAASGCFRQRPVHQCYLEENFQNGLFQFLLLFFQIKLTIVTSGTNQSCIAHGSRFKDFRNALPVRKNPTVSQHKNFQIVRKENYRSFVIWNLSSTFKIKFWENEPIVCCS